MKAILKYIILFISMIIIFSVSMIITYSLPNGAINENVKDSYEEIIKSSNMYGQSIINSYYDTYSDMLILNMALNRGTDINQSSIERAFENSRYSESISDKTFGGQEIPLKKVIYDRNLLNNQEYSRYWHGTQTLIRPLLMIFTYNEIKFLMTIILFMLLFWASYEMNKNVGKGITSAFIFSMLIVAINAVPMVLQFAPPFMVMLIGIIILNILIQKDKEKFIPYLFFLLGSVIAFYDTLTVPIITLGIPLINLIIYNYRKNVKIRTNIFSLIKNSALWGVAYASTYVSKWIIASVVLGKDAISLAIKNLFFRIDGDLSTTVEISILNSIEQNLKFLTNEVFWFLVFIIIIIFCITIIRKKIIETNVYKLIIPTILIITYPFIWYGILIEHSINHAYISFRMLSITVFGILAFMVECTGNMQKREDETKLIGENKVEDKNVGNEKE